MGANSVEDADRLSALRLLLRQFESPLVLILAFAAAFSLVLQQWLDAGIILAIVLGSSPLSFYQGYRASTAVEDLKKRLALTARVLRDGAEQVLDRPVIESLLFIDLFNGPKRPDLGRYGVIASDVRQL